MTQQFDSSANLINTYLGGHRGEGSGGADEGKADSSGLHRQDGESTQTGVLWLPQLKQARTQTDNLVEEKSQKI